MVVLVAIGNSSFAVLHSEQKRKDLQKFSFQMTVFITSEKYTNERKRRLKAV